MHVFTILEAFYFRISIFSIFDHDKSVFKNFKYKVMGAANYVEKEVKDAIQNQLKPLDQTFRDFFKKKTNQPLIFSKQFGQSKA